jgi:hypothetical protein
MVSSSNHTGALPTFFVALWQQNMINYATSSDEESCTLKRNLASKIEI